MGAGVQRKGVIERAKVMRVDSGGTNTNPTNNDNPGGGDAPLDEG